MSHAGGVVRRRLRRTGCGYEAHLDFERDFRGDTLHPAVMENLEELGLAERLLELRHTKVRTVAAQTPGGSLQIPLGQGYAQRKTRFPYITVMAQSRFLTFITQEAQRYPTFRLVMGDDRRPLRPGSARHIMEHAYPFTALKRAQLRSTLALRPSPCGRTRPSGAPRVRELWLFAQQTGEFPAPASSSACPDGQYPRAAGEAEAMVRALIRRAICTSWMRGLLVGFLVRRARARFGLCERPCFLLTEQFSRARALLWPVGEALAENGQVEQARESLFIILAVVC